MLIGKNLKFIREEAQPFDERGIILVLFALTLPVLIALLALLIDISITLYRRSEAQRVADVTAISAVKAAKASAALQGSGNPRLAGLYEAYETAKRNGFSNSCGASNPTGPCVSVNSPPSLPASRYFNMSDAFEINITMPQTQIWAVFFNSDNATLSVRAVGSMSSATPLAE